MPQVELKIIATVDGKITVHWPSQMPPRDVRKILCHAIIGMDHHEGHAGNGILLAGPSVPLDQIVKKAG